MALRKDTRGRLVAGNWKMNGSRASIDALLGRIATGLQSDGRVSCVVFPSFPYLGQVREHLSNSAISWGAQDVSEHHAGAFTGEVAGTMLAEFGCRYVLVGHSERRQFLNETDDRVAAKFQAAQSAGLVPVLCIGETLREYESGQTLSVVCRQLDAVLQKVASRDLLNAIIAYEPVWAIGTGRNATSDLAQNVHASLRTYIAESDPQVAASIKILYGGSVKASNASDLFAMPDIDGVLVGGASLNADEFLRIVHAAI